MATDTEAAAKAFRLAEERFLAGDLGGALRVSRNARTHFDSLPALQSALAAYEVHDAARGGERNCWYAVLGVGQPEPVTLTHDHDAIKKRYKRLCLVLHPDKNRSAAADGAFKLLQRAWEVLSARHPPGAEPEPRPPPAGGPDPDWWSSFFGNSPPPPGAAPNGDSWSSYFRSKPSGASSTNFNFNAWRARHGYKRGTAYFNAWRTRYAHKAYCGHCGSGSESPAAAAGGGTPGGRCHACGTPFNNPAPAGTAADEARQQRDDDDDLEEKFACPTECSRCKTPFSSSQVSTGMCKIRCQACSYDAFVYVYSRHRATAF